MLATSNSIHIAGITLRGLQLLHILRRLLGGFSAGRFDHVMQARRPRPSPCAWHRRRHRNAHRPRAMRTAPRRSPACDAARRFCPSGRGKRRCRGASERHRERSSSSSSRYRKSVAARWSPKNSQFFPLRPMALRSCRKARNGAMPVPGPTMIIGVSPLAGGRKALFECTNTPMRVVPGCARSARKVEQTPLRGRPCLS